jgi:hypothetical protein
MIIVLPLFSPEPQFEPELMRTEPGFGPKFEVHIELNAMFGSAFSRWLIVVNPSKPV